MGAVGFLQKLIGPCKVSEKKKSMAQAEVYVLSYNSCYVQEAVRLPNLPTLKVGTPHPNNGLSLPASQGSYFRPLKGRGLQISGVTSGLLYLCWGAGMPPFWSLACGCLCSISCATESSLVRKEKSKCRCPTRFSYLHRDCFDPVQDYDAAKKKVAESYPSPDARPLVAWLYYQPASQWADELVELKFGAFQADYMQDAGGRMLDFDALKNKYTPNNENIKQKDGARSLEFKNLHLVNDTLAEILKDVKILVDETNHAFIPGHAGRWRKITGLARLRLGSLPESSNKDLTVERVAQIYKIADSPFRQSLE
eukprot:1146660-Pelagomonas_calceolata.AAC.8